MSQPDPSQFLYGPNGLGPKTPKCVFGLVFRPDPAKKYGLLGWPVSPTHFWLLSCCVKSLPLPAYLCFLVKYYGEGHLGAHRVWGRTLKLLPTRVLTQVRAFFSNAGMEMDTIVPYPSVVRVIFLGEIEHNF